MKIAGKKEKGMNGECVFANEEVRNAARKLGSNNDIEPFMVTAFMGLAVIPHLKITTLGLVDVDKQEIVPLFVEEN